MADITIIEQASDHEIADWLAFYLSEIMARRDGLVVITVAGGSTPFPIIEHLLAHDLDWTRLVVWPNDDRIVPEDHEASNTGKLRTLFEFVGGRVTPLVTETEDVPHFDLAWLGMGVDGHIASLFPNSKPQVDEKRSILRLTPDPLPPEAPFDRISLTLPALLDSSQIVFVIRGAEKRAVFERAMADDSDSPVAKLLSSSRQPITCFT